MPTREASRLIKARDVGMGEENVEMNRKVHAGEMIVLCVTEATRFAVKFIVCMYE